MRKYAIAAIPVDGIGPEVITAGLEVLQELAQKAGSFHLKVEVFPWGSDYYKQHGAMMPKDGLERLRPFSAISCVAIGAPAPAKLRDLLDHKDLGTAQNSYSAEVPTHGTVLMKVPHKPAAETLKPWKSSLSLLRARPVLDCRRRWNPFPDLVFQHGLVRPTS
jgi:hypothetical protein